MKKDILYKLTKYNNKLINEDDKQLRIVYGEKINQYINQLTELDTQVGGGIALRNVGDSVTVDEYNELYTTFQNDLADIAKISTRTAQEKDAIDEILKQNGYEILVLSAVVDSKNRNDILAKLGYDFDESYNEIDDDGPNAYQRVKKLRDDDVPSLMSVVEELGDTIPKETADALASTAEKMMSYANKFIK